MTASGATIELKGGESLLDFKSGGFGHDAERIVDAVLEQIRRIPLSTRHFLSSPLAETVSRLAEVCPADLDVSYLCNSGSEAVEGALKLARGYQRKDRRHFLAVEGAWHGSTLGALSVCGIAALRRPFCSLPLQTVFVPSPESLLDQVDEKVVAVIVEPWPVGAEGWLRDLQRRCRETGVLLIADETRTGMGRCGSMLAVELEGVVPDVLVIGGPLGGGVVPVAGYVTRPSINDRVYGRRDPTLHASATGGNPAACAAALAVIDALSGEMTKTIAERSEALRDGLTLLASTYPGSVCEVRGAGLSFWVEFHDAGLPEKIVERAGREGVTFGLTRRHPAAALIFPPLTVTPEEVQRGLDVLGLAIRDIPGSTHG